jgi:hypothetical protein
VKDVVYTVYHDTSATATISRVYADVVITDLPNYASSVSVIQSFQAKFSSDAPSSAISKNNGNQVKR